MAIDPGWDAGILQYLHSVFCHRSRRETVTRDVCQPACMHACRPLLGHCEQGQYAAVGAVLASPVCAIPRTNLFRTADATFNWPPVPIDMSLAERGNIVEWANELRSNGDGGDQGCPDCSSASTSSTTMAEQSASPEYVCDSEEERLIQSGLDEDCDMLFAGTPANDQVFAPSTGVAVNVASSANTKSEGFATKVQSPVRRANHDVVLAAKEPNRVKAPTQSVRHSIEIPALSSNDVQRGHLPENERSSWGHASPFARSFRSLFVYSFRSARSKYVSDGENTAVVVHARHR